MMDLHKMKLPGQKKSSVLLGLSLDGGKLEGVVLKRVDGALQIQQTFTAMLTLDPLASDPQLVGREIRNHLDAAEVRVRHCVFALPLKWALTTQTKLPELAEADVAGFLQIEAERGFHADAATLMTGVSRFKTASGVYATQVGIPRNHITTIEAVLRAAGLRPESFSPGITVLQPPKNETVLTLLIGESNVSVQITGAFGVVMLRTLENAVENEGGRRTLNSGMIARELRITFAQLEEGMRNSLKMARVFGSRDLAQQLADEIQLRFEAMDIEAEVFSKFNAGEFGVGIPAEAPVTTAFAIAARVLSGQGTRFEFLPPRVSAFQELTAKYATGKLRKAGAVAAGILLLVMGVFLIQQIQLWRLRSQWSDMKSKVGELDQMQANIRQYRPWFDESHRTLSILRQLTSAFPEDGVVSAKTIEIRDVNAVSCTGVARDNQSWLQTYGRLQKVPNVADLKVDRIQGKAPVQFTFDFHWVEGGANAN
ncbi:MAG: hypothetical protein HOP33_03935 [Verrucomicrobia bacterium]|nr:hypothetical protein [Verrucomicrobiota bacterium]